MKPTPGEGRPDPGSGDPPAGKPSGLSGWVERRAKRVVGDLYEDRADDLEERAVRAMRQAIAGEADRIKDVIEHGVAVKRREVRLSLLVLVTAALVYLGLHFLVGQG